MRVRIHWSFAIHDQDMSALRRKWMVRIHLIGGRKYTNTDDSFARAHAVQGSSTYFLKKNVKVQEKISSFPLKRLTIGVLTSRWLHQTCYTYLAIDERQIIADQLLLHRLDVWRNSGALQKIKMMMQGWQRWHLRLSSFERNDRLKVITHWREKDSLSSWGYCWRRL
jgi:hypothetical protein